ncbi:MAG: BACON domain-containing protein, partial [Candidatus Cryptobacteroides sp.]|nr:BACON domain-containing protein [Rikenellaceae bacterium]MDY5747201.1 BACON domain-containing protein [Candidatus Cryptobacteroides sp.]
MKLKHIFFAMAASLAVLAGCQKPVDFGPEEVTIISPSETVIDVPVEGTEITVSLKATVDWALQGYTDEVRSWLSISPDSGKASKDAQTITVKVLANEDVDRKADIVFYGNIMCKAPLTISQKGAKGDGQNISIADFLAKKDTETEYTLTGVIGDISNGASYYGFSL